jgi:hypothetical protein
MHTTIDGRKEIKGAPMTERLKEEKVAPVLLSSTTLKMVKTNFTIGQFFFIKPCFDALND